MTTLLGFVIAVPYLTISLYIFTKMFIVLTADGTHSAIKMFAGITMICAIVTSGLVLYGAGELATLLDAVLRSIA